ELAEDDAGVELGDPSGVRLSLAADQHAAGDDHVERLPVLARVENDLALQVSPLVKQAVDDAQFAARKRREQRELPHDAKTRRLPGVMKQRNHRGGTAGIRRIAAPPRWAARERDGSSAQFIERETGGINAA